ncbi:F-box protein [Pyrus ussuriensis x Pyrus communis]|uniref:F-box protein n=1 Tax=Pyrus ussuriensis x Pyrus communis TaxID=2448454 RepID=A0A5N5H5P0_9ROSA|nr:F-box protein [Pyrus ussuriensis x Pyrus communis]
MKKLKACCRHPPSSSDGSLKLKVNEEEEHDHKPYILQLPDDVTVQIFCKLPIKTLVECNRTCKSWRCLLSDPQFTEDLFSRTPDCLLFNELNHPKSKGQFLRFSKIIYPNVKANVREYSVVGSCNGFLCYRESLMYPSMKEVHCFYLSNPVTGESLTLPTPAEPAKRDCLGFGFSPVSNLYKVVRIMRPFEGSCDVMVLKVGSGIWRKTGESIYSFHGNCGVYLNGFLYWIAQSRNRDRPFLSAYGIPVSLSAGAPFLCAFDVERECFQQLPLPPCRLHLTVAPLKLGVLNGCLFLILRSTSNMIEIWVMKESWTKEHEFTYSSKFCVTKILKFTKEGKILFTYENQLWAYTPKRVVRVDNDGFPSNLSEGFLHIPNFAPLWPSLLNRNQVKQESDKESE